ncbi:hypothetical protein DHW03_03315 [Pedobacter yonginense]|uniref:Uncharacterized protein n=1 Tax=Pedobacter yonginense TaxID=651869 RepID=A0A317ES08_9SPHI|nr:hypothetical protein DHW03_03315 [Pedobacter yonginense]
MVLGSNPSGITDIQKPSFINFKDGFFVLFYFLTLTKLYNRDFVSDVRDPSLLRLKKQNLISKSLDFVD